jgi:AraC-like DNA-binding protein
MINYPILSQPWSWKIISTLFRPDQPSIKVKEHWDWAKDHLHGHPHREVLFALKGSCYYCLEDKVYPCQPGTIFLFDTGDVHDNYYGPFTDKVEHLWFSLLEEHMFARVLKVKEGQVVGSRSMNWLIRDVEYRSLLNRRWNEAISRPEQAAALRRYKLLAALMNVVYHVSEMGGKDGDLAGVPRHQKQVVDTIKDHIRKTAGKGLTLDSLARIAGYSKYHFLRVFSKHTGQSVHDYINVCRLQRAKDLQKRGMIKKEIAEELGFSCLAAFSRWYKDMQAVGFPADL